MRNWIYAPFGDDDLPCFNVSAYIPHPARSLDIYRESKMSITEAFPARKWDKDGIIIQSPNCPDPKKPIPTLQMPNQNRKATTKHGLSVGMIIYRGQLVPVLVHLFQSRFPDAAPHRQQDHARDNQYAHGKHHVADDEDSTRGRERQSPISHP